MASFSSSTKHAPQSPWVKARASLPTAAKARVEPTLGDPIIADRRVCRHGMKAGSCKADRS